MGVDIGLNGLQLDLDPAHCSHLRCWFSQRSGRIHRGAAQRWRISTLIHNCSFLLSQFRGGRGLLLPFPQNQTQPQTMYNPMLLKVWLAFQVGGLVGLPILIATLWISGLKRLKTLHNLFLTWIFSAIVSSLLYAPCAFSARYIGPSRFFDAHWEFLSPQILCSSSDAE